MKIFFSLSILFIIVAFLANCKQSNKIVDKSPNIAFFDPIQLGATNNCSNICMEARFSECGEWGGHKEKITVYADSNRNIHARYQVYPYNCNSLQFYYGNENLTPLIVKVQMMGDKKKQVIMDYIQQLTQAKIRERPFDKASHAANVFTLISSDSTFLIRLISNRESDVKNFKRLVSELFN